MADKLPAAPLPTSMTSASPQRGMALLFFIVLLGLTATYHFTGALENWRLREKRDQQTAFALAQAKTALIGFAAMYDDNHTSEVFGYLPCPDTNATDTNGEGSQTPCGSKGVSQIGRLPWKTLKTSPLRDGYGECLWYAVSGNYKDNPKTSGLNPDSIGLLQVVSGNGGSHYLAGPADPAIAVIFSPGPAMAGQSRSSAPDTTNCGGNYVATNYLDPAPAGGIDNAKVSTVANSPTLFIAAADASIGSQTGFNDRLIIVTRSDIFRNYCKKYANHLVAQISTSGNLCNTGGTASSACTDDYVKLNSHCWPQTCRDAASTLTGPYCLADPGNPTCQSAIADLRACHA